MKVKSLSRVRLFATPSAVAYQGFSSQEYWSGVPLKTGSLAPFKEEYISITHYLNTFGGEIVSALAFCPKIKPGETTEWNTDSRNLYNSTVGISWEGEAYAGVLYLEYM